MMDKLPKLRDSKADGRDEKLKLKNYESELAKKE
jgi:hypothetical protein